MNSFNKLSVVLGPKFAFFIFMGLFCFGLSLSSCNSGHSTGGHTDSTANAGLFVKLVVAYKADSVKTIDSIPVSNAKTTVAYVMKVAMQRNQLSYASKPGQHAMITSIDGLATNSAKQYWWLCVNDTCAAAGFEDQQVVPGSTIAWHYVTDGKQPCKNCSYNN